jgi:hypothetical protein
VNRPCRPLAGRANGFGDHGVLIQSMADPRTTEDMDLRRLNTTLELTPPSISSRASFRIGGARLGANGAWWAGGTPEAARREGSCGYRARNAGANVR